MKPSEQFALNQWLTDYPDNLTYDEVIDELQVRESDAVIPWDLVEGYSPAFIAGLIDDTRRHFASVTNEEK